MADISENNSSVLNIGFLRSSLLETKGTDLIRPNLFFIEFNLNTQIEKDIKNFSNTEDPRRLYAFVKNISLPERKINVIEYKRMGKTIQIPTVGEWETDLVVKFHLDDKRKVLSFIEYLYHYSQNRGLSKERNRKIWTDSKFEDKWSLTVFTVSRQWILKDMKDNTVSEDSEKFEFLNKWGSVAKTMAANAVGSIPGSTTLGWTNFNAARDVAEEADRVKDIDQLGKAFIQSFDNIFIKSVSNIEFDHSSNDQSAEISVTFGFTNTFLGPVEWDQNAPIEELYPFRGV